MMFWICVSGLEIRNMYRIFMWLPLQKHPHGRLGIRQYDNINMDLRDVGCEDVT
jgi:hypothetical protein